MFRKPKSKDRPTLPETPPQAEPEAKKAEPELDSFDFAIRAAELGGDVPVIDLHGRTQDQAEHELELFINHAFMEDEEAVKIIHGKGGGWLKDRVNKCLTNQHRLGLVAKFRGSTNLGEHNAVTYAALYPKK